MSKAGLQHRKLRPCFSLNNVSQCMFWREKATKKEVVGIM